MQCHSTRSRNCNLHIRTIHKSCTEVLSYFTGISIIQKSQQYSYLLGALKRYWYRRIPCQDSDTARVDRPFPRSCGSFLPIPHSHAAQKNATRNQANQSPCRQVAKRSDPDTPNRDGIHQNLQSRTPKPLIPEPKDRSFRPKGGAFDPNTDPLLTPPKNRAPPSDDREENGSGAELTSGARTRTPAPGGRGGLDAPSIAGSGGRGRIRSGVLSSVGRREGERWRSRGCWFFLGKNPRWDQGNEGGKRAGFHLINCERQTDRCGLAQSASLGSHQTPVAVSHSLWGLPLNFARLTRACSTHRVLYLFSFIFPKEKKKIFFIVGFMCLWMTTRFVFIAESISTRLLKFIPILNITRSNRRAIVLAILPICSFSKYTEPFPLANRLLPHAHPALPVRQALPRTPHLLHLENLLDITVFFQ